MTIEQNSPAVAGQVERDVIPHNFGPDEGGYVVCTHCGMAEHKRSFDGFRYWFSGVGYNSDRGCLRSIKAKNNININRIAKQRDNKADVFGV